MLNDTEYTNIILLNSKSVYPLYQNTVRKMRSVNQTLRNRIYILNIVE